MILITKKRDETSMENFDGSNLNDNCREQLLEKVEILEVQSEALLNQVEKLEGIRGALEEKVSAYRFRLKEVTKKLEDIDVSSSRDIVVYHNKDNLERRRFILGSRVNYQQECSNDSEKAAEINYLQDKYERLLDQYMHERDKNEQLFNYLFQKEENVALDLFVKADAADTLLDATTLSRKIIQRAEDQAKHIGSNLKEQLNRVLKQENDLPQVLINDLKYGIRCLEE